MKNEYMYLAIVDSDEDMPTTTNCVYNDCQHSLQQIAQSSRSLKKCSSCCISFTAENVGYHCPAEDHKETYVVCQDCIPKLDKIHKEELGIFCKCGDLLKIVISGSDAAKIDINRRCRVCNERTMGSKGHLWLHCEAQQGESGSIVCAPCAIQEDAVAKCALTARGSDDDRVVARFSEDPYSLAFVLLRSGSALSIRSMLLFCTIYIIQIVSLFTLAWCWFRQIHIHVIIPQKVHCDEPASLHNDSNSMANVTMYISTTVYDIATNYTKCEELRSVGSFGLEEKPTRFSSFAEGEANSSVFGLSSFVSTLLLTTYSLNTFANALMMKCISFDYKMKAHGVPSDKSKANFLYRLAFVNALLISAAYVLGISVLMAYPFYVDIGSPTEMILTPISIVCVLEIDNVLFVSIRPFFPKAMQEEYWVVRKSQLESNYNAFYFRQVFGTALFFICLTLICIFVWMKQYHDGSTFDVNEATQDCLLGVCSAVFFVEVCVLIHWTCNCKICSCQKKCFQYQDELE